MFGFGDVNDRRNGREADRYQRLGTGISRTSCQSLSISSVPDKQGLLFVTVPPPARVAIVTSIPLTLTNLFQFLIVIRIKTFLIPISNTNRYLFCFLCFSYTTRLALTSIKIKFRVIKGAFKTQFYFLFFWVSTINYLCALLIVCACRHGSWWGGWNWMNSLKTGNQSTCACFVCVSQQALKLCCFCCERRRRGTGKGGASMLVLWLRKRRMWAWWRGNNGECTTSFRSSQRSQQESASSWANTTPFHGLHRVGLRNLLTRIFIRSLPNSSTRQSGWVTKALYLLLFTFYLNFLK